MTHERWVDDRMLAWLEAGPSDAPLRTLEAGIAYARAHPRRVSPAGVARALATRLGLGDVGPRPRRLSMATVVTAVVVVSVVAGGALLLRGLPGREAGGAPPSVPAATPTNAPTPTPLPALPVEVVGSQACEMTANGVESVAGDVTQARGLVLSCTQTASDPRLAGTLTITMHVDRRPDLSAETWGRTTLENGAGSWAGAWTGTSDPGDTARRMTGVLLGSGAFEGLRFRYSQVASGDERPITGTLERLETIPPQGVPTVEWNACSLGGYGTTTTADGLEQTRGMLLRCVSLAGDPRLEGVFTLRVDTDGRPDGTTAMRGTSSLANDDGAWTGSFEGTVAVGYTTHRLAGTLVGSGPYAGLEYRFTLIGTPDTVYVMNGVIVAAE